MEGIEPPVSLSVERALPLGHIFPLPWSTVTVIRVRVFFSRPSFPFLSSTLVYCDRNP